MEDHTQQPQRGIVIAVPQQYEEMCLKNILTIRKFNCMLPIEIWEVGEEISPNTREKYRDIENLTFKNVNDYCSNGAHWKGFQIKAFIVYHSSFNEIMLCDSDTVFYQNPEILFQDENYLIKGAYFFRDLEKWKFSRLTNILEQLRQKISYKKFHNVSFFLARKAWLTRLLPSQSALFPAEWAYIYSDKIPRKPVKEALQEAGVVLMNRAIHQESIEHIYRLNDNHKETYQYVWGDKETFWIGCVMANKDFYFNPSSGYISKLTKKLTHDYQGKVFFGQKG